MGKRTYITVLFAIMVLVAAAPALAQEEMGPMVETDEVPTVEKRVYIYEVRDRRDPFASLIREEEERTLTGNPLLDNDISQMRVIAIVWDAVQSYALFGLPDGKFYTITEGMKIGLHGGHVEEILEDSVVIREQKPDFRGDLRPVDTYIRLRKEEGQ